MYIMESLLYISSLLLISWFCSKNLIKYVANYFIKHTKLYGLDMGRKDKNKVPESLGIVVGLVYIFTYIACYCLLPMFEDYKRSNNIQQDDKLAQNLGIFAAITSITAMLILGFIDDCYDLRWRYKLLFPLIASIPLVGVYYLGGEGTDIKLPNFLHESLGINQIFNLGIFYYIYMFMFVIFCTNTINIYSGINGLEVGQSIVLASTVVIYNAIELFLRPKNGELPEKHEFSAKLLIPFVVDSFSLYQLNKYPAQVFVGDSYCYFAGMTLGVAGTLSHISEEILLFAMPQVVNFLISIPQLFKVVPCPRHRLPYFNQVTGLREASTFTFKKSQLSLTGKTLLRIYSFFRLCRIDEANKDAEKDTCISTNLTLLNVWLCIFGPMHEDKLCKSLLLMQTCLSAVSLSVMIAIKISI